MLVIEVRMVDPKVLIHHVKNDLETIQGIVGGYLEPIKLDSQHLMLVDEEGRMKNRDINPVARQVLVQARYPEDGIIPIHGDVVIVGTDGPDFTDVGQKAVDYVFWAMERVGL